MRKAVFALLALWLVPALVGCGNSEDESLTVAKAFWKAMENEDIETARSLCTEETAGSITVNGDEKSEDVAVTFGRVEIIDGESHVTTTIAGENEDGSIMSIPMETILVRRDGEWKVDATRTMMSVLGGAMGAMMDAMKEGMEEMGKAMAESMQSSIESADATAARDDGD
ncbi:MAG: hypothetical protein JSW50_10820 [Candidatus Latescibacterota bacterium]|nr:MAG: hypothetical protein JSW50_10820 [Candidatus Latescibacterota bacterium]